MDSRVLYRKAARTLKQELDAKFPNGNTVVFMDCKDYKLRLPTITVDKDSIKILGSEYQIFNMKRSDAGPYWDYFYRILGIDVLTEKPC